MAELDNKILAIQQMQNLAKTLSELDDDAQAILKLITAREWNTTGAPTDEELAGLGIASADVVSFLTTLTQFGRFMGNQSVTTGTYRVYADQIKAL